MVRRDRILPAAALVVVPLAIGGCGGGGGKAHGSGGPSPVGSLGTGYTSDQLGQALLTDIAGYRRTGEPDAGEYGSLPAIQNFNQLQRQVRLDKPQCSGAAIGGLGTVQPTVPAALTTFAKGNAQSVTETLMGVPAGVAEQQLKARVPQACRSFRVRVGNQWSTSRVTEVGPGDIGDGSRTVGVTTTSGRSQVSTWYVVLRGRGYLATITLYGPRATQEEAELLARQGHAQAERILP